MTVALDVLLAVTSCRSSCRIRLDLGNKAPLDALLEAVPSLQPVALLVFNGDV